MAGEARRTGARWRRWGLAVVVGLVPAAVLASPATADDGPNPPGTTPGEQPPADGGDGTIGTVYTCTPEVDIQPRSRQWDGKDGYAVQIVLDRATCPAVDLYKEHFGFTCHIRFHRDGSWTYDHSVNAGLSSIGAGAPDLLICETWVSKAFLSNADSTWTIRAWASMKDFYPQAQHVNDMYRQKTFNVRDDGTIIYRIFGLGSG